MSTAGTKIKGDIGHGATALGAVRAEGRRAVAACYQVLDAAECGELVALARRLGLDETYPDQRHCHLSVPVTEHMPPELRERIEHCVHHANAAWWQFAIYERFHSGVIWYPPRRSMPIHTDLTQETWCNKLAASLQLSASDDYEGGTLRLWSNGTSSLWSDAADRQQGTMVVYPSFTPHVVDEVTAGERWGVLTLAEGPAWR